MGTSPPRPYTFQWPCEVTSEQVSKGPAMLHYKYRMESNLVVCFDSNLDNKKHPLPFENGNKSKQWNQILSEGEVIHSEADLILHSKSVLNRSD